MTAVRYVCTSLRAEGTDTMLKKQYATEKMLFGMYACVLVLFPELVMGRRWWAGPGLGRSGPGRAINFSYDGPWPGPARPIKFSFGGPRPGPAHQFFRGWAAARPSPSHFDFLTAQPRPAHYIFKYVRPARPGP